jgi:hypothetical protein
VTAKTLASFLCFALGSAGCGRGTQSSSSERVADRSETGVAASQGTSAPPPTASRDPADLAFARDLVGSSLGALLDAFAKRPAVKARFEKLVGADRTTIKACTEFRPSEKLGETLVAQACRPRMCDGYQVIVVVDLVAGTLNCGLATGDRVTVYSEDPQNIPAPLVAWRKKVPASSTSHPR